MEKFQQFSEIWSVNHITYNTNKLRERYHSLFFSYSIGQAILGGVMVGVGSNYNRSVISSLTLALAALASKTEIETTCPAYHP